MAAPNEEESKAIELLRERVGDLLSDEDLKDDYFLLRWIRARDLNLTKAEEMLRSAMKWRIENNIDDVLDRKIEPYFAENYPRWIGGTDKENRPLYIAAVGKWDLRTVVRLGKSQGFFEYTTQGFELLMQLMKQETARRGEQGHTTTTPITQVITIFDFEGFPWGQLFNFRAVGELLQLGSLYEAYYPEILHSSYFVNSPSLISKILQLLKPILAPKTMAKIRCFGTNKEEWQAALLQVIDVDQLIPQLGGKKFLTLDLSQ